MSDVHERARAIVEGWPQTVCVSGKSGLIRDIASALRAERQAVWEAAAKLADEKAYTTDPYDPGYGYSCAASEMAKTLRQRAEQEQL